MRLRITRSIIPNLLTLANLFLGFTGIAYISEHEYEMAALILLCAGIFDVMDGIVARLVHSASQIGIQLDSFADSISFGIAPSMMLYMVYFHTLGPVGLLLASITSIMAVLRLARFNSQATFEDKMYFKGMPVPSTALLIVSYIIFYFLNPNYDNEWKIPVLYAIVIISAISMITNVKFDNLPRPDLAMIKKYPINFLVALVGFILIIATSGKLLFPFMAFYVVASYIRHIYELIRKRNQKHKLKKDEKISSVDKDYA
jgi:CDP-diacylglycerol--serine O-phosphatidyltransferase